MLNGCLSLLIAVHGISGYHASIACKGKLLLRGRVDSVEVTQPNISTVLLVVNLKMALVNLGTDPLILLQDEPWFPGAAIAATPEDIAKGNFLASRYGGQAASVSAAWIDYHRTLDRATPPPEKTRILKPNESWELGVATRFLVPARDNDQMFFPVQKGLETIRRLSPVWISVDYEPWPENLELRVKDRASFPFGRTLQKRWEKSGLLCLDSVTSEPISLDMKKAN